MKPHHANLIIAAYLLVIVAAAVFTVVNWR